MAAMFDSGSASFCLIVGAVIVVEAGVFFVLRVRRRSERPDPRGAQWPMLSSLGVMLISSGAARLGRWTGAANTAAFVVGAAAAVATIALSARWFLAQRRAGGTSRQDAL